MGVMPTKAITVLHATAIGSVPHREVRDVCSVITAYFGVVPFWPQLPRRDPREDMYRQLVDGIPGVREEGLRVWVDTRTDREANLLQAYRAHLDGDLDAVGVDLDRATGLKWFIGSTLPSQTRLFKGQMAGPVSFGLALRDAEGRPLIYDEEYMDAVVHLLALKATWLQKQMALTGFPTLIFLDEPYLSTIGSGHFAYDRERAYGWIREVLSSISGLRGVHCCGNTDWAALLDLPLDVLSFDAYEYLDTLLLYPDALRSFLLRGGILAWGMVPTTSAALAAEDVEGLANRLLEAMERLAAKCRLDRAQLAAQSLVTPACGLASLSVSEAERALKLTRELSSRIRAQLGVAGCELCLIGGEDGGSR